MGQFGEAYPLPVDACPCLRGTAATAIGAHIRSLLIEANLLECD